MPTPAMTKRSPARRRTGSTCLEFLASAAPIPFCPCRSWLCAWAWRRSRAQREFHIRRRTNDRNLGHEPFRREAIFHRRASGPAAPDLYPSSVLLIPQALVLDASGMVNFQLIAAQARGSERSEEHTSE